jgi:hypothetical protein
MLIERASFQLYGKPTARNGMLSPNQFERQQIPKAEGV